MPIDPMSLLYFRDAYGDVNNPYISTLLQEPGVGTTCMDDSNFEYVNLLLLAEMSRQTPLKIHLKSYTFITYWLFIVCNAVLLFAKVPM